MRDMGGKSALVTGAQRGIGAAIARRLARNGARVWINAVELGERAIRVNAAAPGGDRLGRTSACAGPVATRATSTSRCDAPAPPRR